MCVEKLVNELQKKIDDRNKLIYDIFFSRIENKQDLLNSFYEIEYSYFDIINIVSDNDKLLSYLLKSINSHNRRLGLIILNDGFIDNILLSNYINDILMFCIDGNDEEINLGINIFTKKLMVNHKKNVFDILQKWINKLDELNKDYKDFYYYHLNLGSILLILKDERLINSYLKYKNIFYDEEIQETYSDFISKLNKDG